MKILNVIEKRIDILEKEKINLEKKAALMKGKRGRYLVMADLNVTRKTFILNRQLLAGLRGVPYEATEDDQLV